MNDETPTRKVPADELPTRTGLAAGARVFGRYTLEVPVGRGGMGVVWRARDEKLERAVALKFLPPEVAADAEAVGDLKRETKRCLDLTHPNIVRVYDFVEEAAGAAIAMEFVEGESLARRKANAPGGCLSVTELAPLLAQLCAALDYAHRTAKVAHHDLKPANILVTREGVLKVTDFGIARSLTETQTRLTSRTGGTSGTLLYMSPQQLAGDKPTAADDIYGLGATLYELLTGKPPFYRGDAFSLMKQVAERPPGPLEQHRAEAGCTGPEIPAVWSETIIACLAKEARDRPASAGEVASRLGLAEAPAAGRDTKAAFATPAIAAGAPGRAEELAAMRAPGPKGAGKKSRAWLPVAAIAAVALLAAGYHYGIRLPEQRRLAADQARLATEQSLAEKTQQEEQAFSTTMGAINGLVDGAPEPEEKAVDTAVQKYLAVAPDRFAPIVKKAWDKRQADWQAFAAANQAASLVVQTDPPGATVTLYPQDQSKTSPATFEGVKPGDVTLRIDKVGYESREIPFSVKPGLTNQPGIVRLTATGGSIHVTSDPTDVPVVVTGPGGRIEGWTPFDRAGLAPGNYVVSFRPSGWRNPVQVPATIELGKQKQLDKDLRGVSLTLNSDPVGARVSLDGQPKGSTPLNLNGLEPRVYKLELSLEGHENYSGQCNLSQDLRLSIPLAEKPAAQKSVAGLRQLAGHQWQSLLTSGFVRLVFDRQGGLVCAHKTPQTSLVRDPGSVVSVDAVNNTEVVSFTSNGSATFFPGKVRIKVVSETQVNVSWSNNGKTSTMIFRRVDAAQAGGSGLPGQN